MKDKLKAWLNAAGTVLLKGFRGLICEQKAGGWELSKGAVMAWILFAQIIRLSQDGFIDGEWVVYTFGGLMGYNATKLLDRRGLVTQR